MKKRILSIVTILCMMLALLPSMAFADGGAEDTSVKLLTKERLATYKGSGGSYVLTSGNYKLSENIVLDSDIALDPDYNTASITTVTLDLNGNTLSRENDETGGYKQVINVNTSCDLTVIDSAGGGKIIGKYPIHLTRGNDYYNAETSFTLESGTIETTSGSAIISRNSGTPTNVILNGGTVIGPISVEGSQTVGQDNLTISSNTVVYGDINGGYNIKLATDEYAAVHKVTFKQNDSTESSTYATGLVAGGSNAVKPTDPTRDEYEFIGWYADKDCKTAYDFDSAVSSATTVYAGWEEAENPVISGITDGQTYCGKATFTVTDNVGIAGVGYYTTGSSSVTTLTADDKGNYTLSAGIGTVTVVATDTSGNKTTVTVTVNDGHTWGDWTDNNGQHSRSCNVDGCSATDTADCTDTNPKDHNCDVCGGRLSNHTYEWQSDSENGQYWQKCSYCGDETDKKTIPDLKIDGRDTVCNGNDYTFKFTLPEGMKNPTAGYSLSDAGGGQLGLTDSGNDVYTATIEDDYYKTCYENGVTTIKVIIEAETSDGYTVTTSKDVNIAKHSGGTATCTDKAVCDTCQQEYGEPDSSNHASTLKHIEAISATSEAAGNIEYWYCTACDKYFADEACTIEIAQADTVIDKLPAETEVATTDDDQSSETGDSFNMGLLIALLIAACGTFTATLYRRRSTR